jgi:uncharacterized protein involved in exopolysaccharide biosynthesis
MMSGMPKEADVSLGFGEVLGAIKRRRMLIAAIVAPTLVIAGALALGLPDVYRSTANFALIGADLDVLRTTYTDEFVYAVADRVKRSPELESIARELEPYPELAGQPEAASRLRDDISVKMVTQNLVDPETGRQQGSFAGFTVVYSNASPDMAARVAERLPTLFIEISRERTLERANAEIRFLTAEAVRKRAEVDEQEKRLAKFKERNFDKLPEIAQANVNLRAQIDRQIEDSERELRGVRQNRVFLVQQLQQEQSGPAISNVRQLEDEYNRKAAIYSSDHPDLIALRRQIDNLRRTGPGVAGSSLQAELDDQRAALAEARQRYSEDHPDVRRMMRSIEALEARIASGDSATAQRAAPTVVSVQLQTQLNALDTQIEGLQARAAEQRNQLNSLDMKLGAAPEVEREFQSITRDLDNARQLYEQLTSKRMTAELLAASIKTGNADRFRVLDAPQRPLEPAEPGRLRIIVLGLILACVLGLGSALAAEILDPNVRGSRDVRNMLQVAPLALVPEIHNSVYAQRHRRRLSLLTASVVVGAPLMFLLVRLLSS